MALFTKIIDLQKLGMAWKKIHVNKPACGADGITWQDFEKDLPEELKKLHMELKEGRYRCQPVKQVTITTNGKEREIVLYCMRDKVIQQSLADEIDKLFDPYLSPQAYAYRKNRSALQIVNRLEEVIRKESFSCVLKLDIHQYFDHIRWNILYQMLESRIKEPEVLDLIREITQAKTILPDGTLGEKRLGLHQGCSLSPILSNVYLMDFDRWLSSQNMFYARYSDDMLLLAREESQLAAIKQEITEKFATLGLEISESKTFVGKIPDGFVFLGYYFDEKGKAIPAKAKSELSQRLELCWLKNRELDCAGRLKMLSEIFTGWKQYYASADSQTEFQDILEYAVCLYLATDETQRKKYALQRVNLFNEYVELTDFFCGIWQTIGSSLLILLEYEQLYSFVWVKKESIFKLPAETVEELILQYKLLRKDETEETWTEIMQIYADAGQYEKSEAIMDYIREALREEETKVVLPPSLSQGEEIRLSEEEKDAFLDLFCGREDIYSGEEIIQGKRKMCFCAKPLTKEKLEAHLRGDETIGTYVQQENQTVKYFVIDVDISRRIMLQCTVGDETYREYLQKAAEMTQRIHRLLTQKGLPHGMEQSGKRGFHVWIFLEGWFPVRYLRFLGDVIDNEIDRTDMEDISIEYFPNKTRIKPDAPGQCIKLPYGCCAGDKRYRSSLMDDSLSCNLTFTQWKNKIVKVPLLQIKKVISIQPEVKPGIAEPEDTQSLEVFGEIPENIRSILAGCCLMRYLCKKAQSTGYLTHFERLSILYVFGHVGTEGQDFVHQVMSYTLNYNESVTEKFIRKCPEKPISCPKLREQYARISAELGCGCNFKRRAKCYPSPVLHAVKHSSDDTEQITLPITQAVNKQTKEELLDEVNIHKKAQLVAARIIEQKKQKKSLDKSIEKMERELDKIFDDAKIESLDLEMGTLVRRKGEKGSEWLIEL